mgnify:CR=1 FL=1
MVALAAQEEAGNGRRLVTQFLPLLRCMACGALIGGVGEAMLHSATQHSVPYWVPVLFRAEQSLYESPWEDNPDELRPLYVRGLGGE